MKRAALLIATALLSGCVVHFGGHAAALNPPDIDVDVALAAPVVATPNARELGVQYKITVANYSPTALHIDRIALQGGDVPLSQSECDTVIPSGAKQHFIVRGIGTPHVAVDHSASLTHPMIATSDGVRLALPDVKVSVTVDRPDGVFTRAFVRPVK